tara:strand:+ start:130 stop:504 length:375 start_codon:yes stop_codon:yes gene_type:complete
MKKLCLSFLAMTMATTVFAVKVPKYDSNNTVGLHAEAKIVDIEEVWRTARVKKYSDCRDILDKKDGLTGRKTLCDNIELITINKSIDYYRVTFDLYGETFILKLKKRPVGTTMTMIVSLYPYNY